MTSNIIPVSFTKLRTVAQIADIHIRLFKRHEEYKETFHTLYNQLRHGDLLNDGIIVVMGDIVHAKTDMSPEMLQLASEFLSTLANIAPTIVVAGNHDLNLANVHRLDALTPIIENLAHPNLHYLKHSGIYRIADTDFAVHSILDDRTKWPSANESTATTKIALYHGPVYGATTDANYTISDRHVFVNTFNGYDITMLGDIHRYQILQERDAAQHLPVIVYSSSLIQQNHGETLGNHGWCLWNIPIRTHQFKELPNKYGYYTLEIINGKIVFPVQLPENVRLRLFTGDADETVIKKVISSLRKKYNVIELSVNRTRLIQGGKRKRADLLDLGDLTSVNVQNSMIETWLKSTHGTSISDKLVTKILDINKRLNNEIEHDDQSRNVHWRPLELRFSNIFSYGEDNVINFTTMNGTYGIFAPNASGKSSSMDALIFALFDKTPRAFKGSDIMNNRRDNFKVELMFEIDNNVYVIRRRGTRKKNGAVKVSVDFVQVNPDGTIVSLNGAERSDTNNNIRSLIGTYEDFVLTALSSQNANSLFIDKSHSERKDLLNQFMGLTIFDKLERVANDLSKEVQGALKKFRGDDFTQLLADIQTELDVNLQKEIVHNIKRNSEAKELEKVEQLINHLYNEKLPIEGGEIDVDKLNEKKNILHDKIIKLEPEIEKIQGQIDSLDTKIMSSPEILCSDTEVTEVTEHITSINKTISGLDQKITKERTLYNSIKERVSWLDTHEYDANCPYCMNNVFFKAALKDKEEMDSHFQQIQILTEQKVIETTNRMSAEETLRKYKEELSTKAAVEKLKTEKLNYTIKLQEFKMTIIELEKKILEIETQLKIYHTQEQAIRHNESIDETLILHKENKEYILNGIAQLDKALREVHAAIEVCKSKKEELLQKVKEAEELELEFEGYRYYMDAVGRDGVPYDLITKIIPNIEAEINNLLTQIVDFTVTLTVDDKNINGKIVYDYERLWPLENSSGMERFISSLAIRVALMKASNLPKPNFLILDEGFSVLDAENMSGISNLFGILKTQFDFIIVISHLDVIRDVVDNIVTIKKEDGYSYIQYV